jgi:NNP family nitrate/nitrite transporter-like MFS transporter
MNDLAAAKASFSEQAVIFQRKHNWLMCWLYLGTFGSFIGYSAGFPLLIKTQFPDVNAMQYAFLGPLVGAIARVIGGWVSDKLGGAVVTFWIFVVMAFAAFGVMSFLPHNGSGGDFQMFFRMIPVIFLTHHQRLGGDKDTAVKQANKEAAAVLGFTSAFAAYGAFFIPKMFGTSIALTGGPEAALYGFITFYVSCLALTWWYYSRKGAEMPC